MVPAFSKGVRVEVRSVAWCTGSGSMHVPLTLLLAHIHWLFAPHLPPGVLLKPFDKTGGGGVQVQYSLVQYCTILKHELQLSSDERRRKEAEMGK